MGSVLPNSWGNAPSARLRVADTEVGELGRRVFWRFRLATARTIATLKLTTRALVPVHLGEQFAGAVLCSIGAGRGRRDADEPATATELRPGSPAAASLRVIARSAPAGLRCGPVPARRTRLQPIGFFPRA
jgi:hypothetical protein